MKIAIVGSRSFRNLQLVTDFVNSLLPDTIIISGGARGVDRTAEQAADARGLAKLIFFPDWDKHGKAAGFLRNKDIVGAADEVVAFWDSKSRGTASSISLAKEAGKKVTIIT